MSAPPAEPQRPGAGPLLPLVAFALSFALYLGTLAPDLLWSDSAKHLIQVAEHDVLGFGHGRHPLHTIAGMLFALLPLPLPYSQNLLSAVAGAIAVALVAATARRFATPPAAALAALALAVAHTFWHYAVINESYALFWACLAATLWAAAVHRDDRSRRSLFLFGLFAGLALAAHGIALLALPGLCWLARPRLRPAGVAVIAFALGSLPVWLPAFLPASETALASRETLGFVASSLSHARLFLDSAKIPRELLRYPLYLGFQFPGLALIALLLGMGREWRRERERLAALLAAAAPVIVFAAGYFLQREFAMLGASYLLLAPLVAAGLEPWLRTRARQLGAALALLSIPILVYAGTTAVATQRGLPFPVRALPFRDEARYFLWPPKSAVDGARRYVEEARLRLPRGATLIADFNAGEPLRYALAVERSLDLRLQVVIDDFFWAGGDPAGRLIARLHEELEAGHEVYLADRYEPYYRVSALAEEFQLSDAGPFIRVRRR